MTFFEDMLEDKTWAPATAIMVLLVTGDYGTNGEKEDFGRILLELTQKAAKEGNSVRYSVTDYMATKALQKEETNPLLYEFINIYQKYKAHFGESYTTPYKFIAWAMGIKSISVSDVMTKWKEEEDLFLMACQPQKEEPEGAEAAPPKPLDRRAETTYKILLAALLNQARKYPFEEHGGQSAVVNWLSRQVEALGCALDEKTYRKCLAGLEDAIRKKRE